MAAAELGCELLELEQEDEDRRRIPLAHESENSPSGR
jgi:hypothetical protein